MNFGYVFVGLAVFIGIFQVLLALGAPLGEFTMGGRFPGKLPNQMRVAALVQIVILYFFTAVVMSKAKLGFESFVNMARIAIWFVLAFFVMGSFVNFSSPSKKEKYVMGPLNIAALISVLMVALS